MKSSHYHWDFSLGISAKSLLGCLLHVHTSNADVVAHVSTELKKLVENAELVVEETLTSSGLARVVRIQLPDNQPTRIPVFSVPFNNLACCGDGLASVLLILQRAYEDVYGKEMTQLDLNRTLEIYAVLLAFNFLKIKSFSITSLPLGYGMSENIDGSVVPVPSPMTLKLLIDFPTCPGPMDANLVTPEALAILKLFSIIDRPNSLVIRSVSPAADNSRTVKIVSRLICGQEPKQEPLKVQEEASEKLWKTNLLTHMEANLDDTTAEALAFAIELLLNNGAVDSWVTPIVMKKGRAAHTLHCLCISDDKIVDKLLKQMFLHTTTLGIRIHRNIERASLKRSFLQVRSGFDDKTVGVKVGYMGEEVVSVKAEFDHCKAIALETGVPLKRISDHAIQSAYDALAEARNNANQNN